MDEGEGRDLFEGQYRREKRQVKIVDGSEVEVEYELRECPGKTLFRDGDLQVIAPSASDFPLESGVKLQAVNKEITTESLKDLPIFKAEPKAVARLLALGLTAEGFVFEKTPDVWANINLHSRAPISDEAPEPTQYNPLVVDIQGRAMGERVNWMVPPLTHGNWGSGSDDLWREREEADTVDSKGKVIPASEEEIEFHQHDPMARVWGEKPPDHASPQDYERWREHPTGMTEWYGRRKYYPIELAALEGIFTSDEFREAYEKMKEVSLFDEDNPESQEFDSPPSDHVLWQFNGYQLVAQDNPLVDKSEGIHIVLEMKPTPHTAWENPKTTLEAFMIGIGVARLLRETREIGEIGDVYIDINSNWGNPMIRGKGIEGMTTTDEIKKVFYEDAGAKMHIQLEKMDARWEIPPAPGTFKDHKGQSKEAIEETQKILGTGSQGALRDWLFGNCRGKIFT